MVPRSLIKCSQPNQGTLPFITGVAYYDINSNGAYDIGEGIGGGTVTSPASGHFSVTADAGGYALPVSSSGNNTVRFELDGETAGEASTEVSDTENVKVDLSLPYVAPAITGAAVASLNQPNIYSFTPVKGANEYDVRISGTDSSAWSESAEIGTLGRIIDNTDPLYSLASNAYAATGSQSFHLTFPNWAQSTDWKDQSFELDREPAAVCV